MNQAVIKWASGVIVLITLCGFIGSSAVRISRIEKEAHEVEGLKNSMNLVLIYLKLQDPILYEKAKQLSN